MVGAREGVEGLMILTRRVAALPVTIVLYHDDVFLVHVVYTWVILVSLVTGPNCSSMTQCFSPPGLSFLSTSLLNMEILSFTILSSLPAILPGLKLLDWSLWLHPL